MGNKQGKEETGEGAATGPQTGRPKHPLQSRFHALTIPECEEYSELKFSDKKISKVNERNERKVKETVQGFLPIETGTAPGLKNLNVVILGKTGAGKSETANLILGKSKFLSSSSATSTTRNLQIEETTKDGVTICVADTPGSFDTDATSEDIATELLKVGMAFREGVHIFLFVMNLGNPRFTNEEKEAFKSIKETFSDEVLPHCIFLFTHAGLILEAKDCEDKTIMGYLKHSLAIFSGADIRDIYESVDYRVVAVENGEISPYQADLQRDHLIAYFQSVVDKKIWDRKTYDPEAFKKAREAHEKRMAENREKYYPKISAEEEAETSKVVLKYLEPKPNAEIKEISTKEGCKTAAKEITEEHPELDPKTVEYNVETKAQVLTDDSNTGALANVGTALLSAAGSYAGGAAVQALRYTKSFF